MTDTRYSNLETPYRNLGNAGFSAGAFAIGLGVGAGLALLFAPRSGNEIRDEITNRASDLADKARDQFDNVRNKVGNLRNTGAQGSNFSDPSVRTGTGI